MGTNSALPPISIGRWLQHFGRRLSVNPETFTVSNVLAQLSGPQTELYVASTLGSELIMSPENVPLARLRIERLVSSQEASAAPRESFQSMTLGNGRAIREAVNSGERSLSEGLELVEKAHKFKHWIVGRPPDTDLLRDYYQEITASTWAEGCRRRSLNG